MKDAIGFLIFMFVILCAWIIIKPHDARKVYEILSGYEEVSK